jgi:cell division initiation protein
MTHEEHRVDSLVELKTTFPVDPESLRRLRLPRVWRRFYDREVVDELLDVVVSSYQAVWRERAELQISLGELQQEVERHKALTESVGSALIHAEEIAVRVRESAEAEAAERVAEARSEVESSLAVIRSDRERATKEVARLDDLRDDLRQTCRAFVLAQLELIEEHLPETNDAELSPRPRPAQGSAEAG